MPHPLHQSEFKYNPITRFFSAPRDTPRPWHGVEVAVAHEIDDPVTHTGGWDLQLDSTEIPPEHPLNPFISSFYHFQHGEIRGAIVRDRTDTRGRFRIRREQHEKMLHRAEHTPPEYHDRYYLAVYDRVQPCLWELLDYVAITAPELHEIRDNWTWSDTGRYEVSQVTWSQIPGLDPLKIEADHDGYWTLDDF